MFQYFLELTRLPDHLARSVLSMDLSPMLVMAGILVAFTALGCFMEGLSIMILAVPLIYPVIIQLHFDPIWFGILITGHCSIHFGSRRLARSNPQDLYFNSSTENLLR